MRIRTLISLAVLLALGACAGTKKETTTAEGTSGGLIQVELLQGASTVIASWNGLPGATATADLDLTTGERNAVTDWADLRVRLTKTGAQADVFEVSLEAPAATPTATVAAIAPTATAAVAAVAPAVAAVDAIAPLATATVVGGGEAIAEVTATAELDVPPRVPRSSIPAPAVHENA